MALKKMNKQECFKHICLNNPLTAKVLGPFTWGSLTNQKIGVCGKRHRARGRQTCWRCGCGPQAVSCLSGRLCPNRNCQMLHLIILVNKKLLKRLQYCEKFCFSIFEQIIQQNVLLSSIKLGGYFYMQSPSWWQKCPEFIFHFFKRTATSMQQECCRSHAYNHFGWNLHFKVIKSIIFEPQTADRHFKSAKRHPINYYRNYNYLVTSFISELVNLLFLYLSNHMFE